MYITKVRPARSLYKEYAPKTSAYQREELTMHIAETISREMSRTVNRLAEDMVKVVSHSMRGE
jgi:hypothetical protein